MSTLIMWVIDLGKTKTRPWRHIYHDIGIPRPESHETSRFQGQKTTTLETETTDPRHRDSKAFFQRTKGHDIEIPRLKNHNIEIPRPKSHDIEFLWNSDPYAPWYVSLVSIIYLPSAKNCRVRTCFSLSEVREYWLLIYTSNLSKSAYNFYTCT